MRIRTLMAIGTVVLVAITAASGFALAWTYNDMVRARDVKQSATAIVEAIFQHQSLASEYLLLGTQRPRQQWEARHRSLLDLVDELPAEIRRGGTATALLRQDIERLGIVFAQLFGVTQRQTGPSAEIENQWRDRLASDFRRISQDTVATAARLADDTRQVERDAEQRAILLLVATVTITMALVLVLWGLIAARVLTRLKLMQTAIKSLETGDLSYRIQLDSRDEIGEVADAFDSMAGELERSQKDLEQFAYVASHDLQEPLRMVASYTELLARRYKGQLDEKADKYIGYAVDGSKRMQALINDLLAFSRVGTRGRPFEPTDCDAVVDEALRNLSASVEESGARITHAGLPVVRADRLQLVQVFQNLIANAIRYRRDEPPRVEISARLSGVVWTFSVKDNGIGIDPAFAERIFIIFQRLHERAETDGNGIGLAIVKKVIERHGGRIWVQSQPQQGSTFQFTLPTTEATGWRQ